MTVDIIKEYCTTSHPPPPIPLFFSSLQGLNAAGLAVHWRYNNTNMESASLQTSEAHSTDLPEETALYRPVGFVWEKRKGRGASSPATDSGCGCFLLHLSYKHQSSSWQFAQETGCYGGHLSLQPIRDRHDWPGWQTWLCCYILSTVCEDLRTFVYYYYYESFLKEFN